MRHETCLSCRYVPADQQFRALTVLTETLTDRTHHHHAVLCEDCGAWWFDDAVIGGLGIPVSARRDTVLCGCPDDGTDRYTRAVINVPVPEAECHCTAADVEKHVVRIRLGDGP